MSPFRCALMALTLLSGLTFAAGEYGAKCASVGGSDVWKDEYREVCYPNYRRQLRAMNPPFRIALAALRIEENCVGNQPRKVVDFEQHDERGHVTSSVILPPHTKEEIWRLLVRKSRPTEDSTKVFWVGTGRQNGSPLRIACAVPGGSVLDRMTDSPLSYTRVLPCGPATPQRAPHR